MAVFKGAGVAIVTPMYEDGNVNYDKLGELIEFQIANSTDAIINLRDHRRIVYYDTWRASENDQVRDR